ncbi:MAG TPA: hypothetical protein VGO22_07090 [Pseudorhizobium sp.]|jgi:hypothetical protein|nr:hypothetical protein [Pseudorhizobium sp.]
MKVEQIIDELKAAPAAVRQLDFAIAKSLGWRRVGTIEEADGNQEETRSTVWFDRHGNRQSKVPRFTESIQAAFDFVHLVFPNSTGGVSWESGMAHAKVGESLVQAATPAIALCLAVLSEFQRMRQTQDVSDV